MNILDVAETMRKRVLASLAVCAALSCAAAETRYLAVAGSDLSDGKTPQTAWRTIEKLNSDLPPGGTALLKCGDVFYGTVKVKGGSGANERTVISSFGEGPKPVISSAKNLRDDPSIWKVKERRYNYWHVDLADPANFTGVGGSNANPGFLLVDGEVKPWRKFCRSDINRQWDFAGDDGELYVYSTNNPALLAKDIRVAVDGHGILLSSHTAVSNVAVKSVGGHGMCAGWEKEPTIDIRIFDCEFENIGGAELLSFKAMRVRYGNAIEFGSNCADVIVERCRIKGVYDVAFTMQGRPTSTSWSDIHMRNCCIEDSSQAFEVWCKGAKPGVGFKRCSFTGNRTVNVGGGWGALSRPNRIVATPLLAYHMETDTVDITVSDNVFEKVSGPLMFVLGGVESLDPGYRIFRNMVK